MIVVWPAEIELLFMYYWRCQDSLKILPAHCRCRLLLRFVWQVDLLLGTWAEQNVPSLTLEEMNSYEDILNLETVDIFNFIAGNAKPPAFVDTPMMARLQVSFPHQQPMAS